MTTISASSTIGIYLTSPSFTNPVVINPGVTISSSGNALYGFYGIWTIQNSGGIASALGNGVYLGSGGSITNAASASIIGVDGVNISGGAGIVVNDGKIAGNTTSSIGVILGAGGSVANQSGATISGYTGVDLTSGGMVTNAASALITGVYEGVAISGGAGTVVNQGKVADTASGGIGVLLGSGGAITNAASASIAGNAFGVDLSAGGTLTNAGTIIGNTGTAAYFGGTNSNLLVLDPGYGLSGVAMGGTSAVNTLELASAASAGTLSGLGTEFVDFGQVTIDAGAQWQMTGINTVAAGGALFNGGTLIMNGANFADAGALVNDGGIQLDPSTLTVASLTGTGSVTIGSSATLTATGTVAGSENILFNGANSILQVSNPTIFAGTIAGFGSFGTIDLTSLHFVKGSTTATVNSGGTLIATNGTTTDSLSLSGPVAGLLVVSADASSSGTDISVTPVAPVRTLVWTGAASTNFAVASNWNDTSDGINPATSPPGATDTAEFGAGAGQITGTGTAATLLFDNNGDWQLTSAATVTGLSQLSIGSGSASSVSVTNGAELATNGTLSVGSGSAGNLSVALGGSVAAGAMDIAALSGGSGIVSATGTGSRLSVTGQLTIGNSASAEVSILNGATVSGTNADVGLNASGTGNIDIEGTGSELSLSGNLNLGDAGTGVLTLGNNTTLQVAGNLNIGATGVLNQFGGNIDPSVVNNTGRAGGKGSISASVSIANSGTLFAASGTETLSAPIITGKGVLEIDSNGDLVVNVGSVVTTQTVTFTDGTGVLTIGTLGGFSAVIGDVIAGNSIEVQGTSIASATFDASTHLLTLFDPSSAEAGLLQFGTSVTDGSIISVNGVTPCFVAGTRIGTERGEVCVEELKVGDLVPVVGAAASPRPIIWLGHRTVDCARHPEPRKVWPVCIRAHAFGQGRPARDLWLSPGHAVFVGHVLIPVRYLINGSTIAQVPVQEVTYYHVELTHHAVLLAEGLPTESYLDTGDRTNFANGGGPITLFPDFASRVWDADGCAPLVVTGPELDSARHWVNALANDLHGQNARPRVAR